MDSAGIPSRYARCTLSSFVTSHPDRLARSQLLEARTTAEQYVERFIDEDTNRFRESGLLFFGPPGVGKTHLAVAVLKSLVEDYRARGRFVDFTTLIHQIQSTFDPGSPESKREVLDPVIRADVLVLDELGAQKPTAWVQDILYLVINTRYTERRPTLFTTNYALERPREPAAEPARPESLDRGADPPTRHHRTPLLEERITAQLVSRLFEMARPVTLQRVGDHRKEIKASQARV
jgi:DNA replication protein DnaC